MGHNEETFIRTFEQPENVEKIVQMIDVGKKERKAKKEEAQQAKKEAKRRKKGTRCLTWFLSNEG